MSLHRENIFLCLCVCMCVCMYIHTWYMHVRAYVRSMTPMCAHTDATGPHQVSSPIALFFILETGSFTISSNMGGRKLQGSSCPWLLRAEVTDTFCCTCLVGAGNPNSDSHACVASTFLAEISPKQLWTLFKYSLSGIGHIPAWSSSTTNAVSTKAHEWLLECLRASRDQYPPVAETIDCLSQWSSALGPEVKNGIFLDFEGSCEQIERGFHNADNAIKRWPTNKSGPGTGRSMSMQEHGLSLYMEVEANRYSLLGWVMHALDDFFPPRISKILPPRFMATWKIAKVGCIPFSLIKGTLGRGSESRYLAHSISFNTFGHCILHYNFKFSENIKGVKYQLLIP